jgi:hypothetical protein
MRVVAVGLHQHRSTEIGGRDSSLLDFELAARRIEGADEARILLVGNFRERQ